MSLAASTRALDELSSWPGYAPTPLHSLSGLARQLGLAALWYKDESQRFGVGSFKAIGGGYAVCEILKIEVQRALRPSGDLIRPSKRRIRVDHALDRADHRDGRESRQGRCLGRSDVQVLLRRLRTCRL